MIKNLEHRADSKEETSRAYLIGLFEGRIKNPKQPQLNDAVSEVIKAILRDASRHRINKHLDFNYALSIARRWKFQISYETVNNREFVDYCTKNESTFTDDIVQKIVPKALALKSDY
jgi:hypothetical protein